MYEETKTTEWLQKQMDEFKQDTVEVLGEGTVSIVSAFLQDTLIGQVTPGVVSAIMSYRQKRLEKNIAVALNEIKKKLAYFEELISSKPTFHETIKNKLMPAVFDYAGDEKQAEKIEYLINGFATMIEYEVSDDDKIYVYYDILRDLIMADIILLNEIAEYRPPEVIAIPGVSTQVDAHEVVNSEEAFRRYQINKMRQQGLIITEESWDSGGQDYIHDIKHLKLTYFGNSFVNFFKVNK
jgi:hypothetical protein